MEVLKNDIRAIQSGIRELATVSGGKLNVPSWKFPSKQAADVDIEEALKNYAIAAASTVAVADTGEGRDDGQKHRFYLLELIVDRLLFLLQRCISLSEQTLGQRSTTNLPLTLSSTVKKFSKRVLQSSAAIKSMQKQISSKDALISSLKLTASKLRDEHSHLELFNNKSSHSTESSDGKDDNLALTRPSTCASSCVPYEAVGTLKMSSFTTLPTETQAIQVRGFLPTTSSSPHPQGTPTSLLLSQQVSLPIPTQQATLSTSTQTTDTAFALCAQCSNTQQTLIEVADSMATLCHEQEEKSSMAEVDWQALAKVDGLEVSKWRQCLKTDLCSVSELCCRLRERVRGLELECDTHKSVVGKLENEMEQLSTQIDALQERVEDIQKTNEVSLASTRESFSSQLTQLERTKDELEAKSVKMREQLNFARSQEAHLKSLVAELEHRRGQLQVQLETVRGREMQLSAAKQELEEELKCSKGELESCRGRLDANQVELSKTKVYSHTVDKRNKSLQAKQANLLSQLDELDQDCAGLRVELEQVEDSRQRLRNEVKDIQTHCNQLQQQLQAEQERLAESHREQEKLVQVVSELEEQLGEVRVQLDQEKHNCRLLMDYPFIKQVSGDYQSHIASMTGQDSERQISANTVRILLLEEQNTELREKRIPQMKTHQHQSYQHVRQATPLWRNEVLSQLQEEQCMARQQQSPKEFVDEILTDETWSNPSIAGPTTASSFNDGHQQNDCVNVSVPNSDGSLWSRRNGDFVAKKNTRPSSKYTDQPRVSTAKLKGRLGHLVAAIAEAHHASSSASDRVNRTNSSKGLGTKSEPQFVSSNAWVSASSSLDSIEVHMCSKCDRMYSNRGELEHHQAVCTS